MITTSTMATTGAQEPMGGEGNLMLSLLDRHKIQVLLSAGHAQKEVAQLADVSVDTVRRVAREAEVSHVDDAAHRRARAMGRPSKASPFTARVLSWLGENAELPTQELLRRAREAGYDGHKTAFYAMVAGIRPPPERAPVVRFEGVPGEFSQHDFGQIDVSFVDGRKVRMHFFASRLKYSRFVVVELVQNEKVETILRGLARAFEAFGGRPLLAVFDRPRTIVKKSGVGRAVEAYNQTFAQGVVDLGVGVEMCAARSGNQKGAVEHLVKWVKNTFFKYRCFVDDEDLRTQLAAWHVEVNTQTPNRETKEIPEKRRQEELARLRPLQVSPETLVLRVPAFVGPTAEVQFEGVSYPMPPKAVNMPATILLHERRLRIVTVGGKLVAEHARRQKGEPYVPSAGERAAKLAAVHGERAKLYEKRQQLLGLGADTLAFITEITHRDGKSAHSAIHQLHALLDRFGADALRAALSRAVETNRIFVTAVRRTLEKSARDRRDEGDGDATSSAPRCEADDGVDVLAGLRRDERAAQPRGRERDADERARGRAETKRGRK